MIQDALSARPLELLEAEDGLEVVLALLRFIHVGRQVRPLLLLPSIFPSIRVFSNESAFHIRWPEY